MLTGIILAGGRNARFHGINKALLPMGGETIIETIIRKLQTLAEEIIIVTNDFDAFRQLARINPPVRLVADIIPERSSLGGLYAGLVNSATEHNLVVACDMPFLNRELLQYLRDHSDGYEVVVPKIKETYEALHAVYARSCRGAIERQLERNDHKIINFYPQVRVREITEATLRQFDPHLASFRNLNTPDEYQAAISGAGAGKARTG